MSTATADLIDNSAIRAALAAAVERGESLTEIARRAGYVTVGGRVDTSRLKRRLGLACDGGYYQTQIGYERAVLIVRALGLDPIDFDI